MKCDRVCAKPSLRGAATRRFKSRVPRHFLSAMVVLLVLAPGVQASPVDALLPPSGLQGTYAGGGTVLLQWEPAGNESASYIIYRNAVLVGQTQETSYEAEISGSPDVFHVTTWLDGNESVPSEPLLVQERAGVRIMVGAEGGEMGVGGSCETVGTDVDPNNFPYLFVVLQPECLPLPIEAPGVIWWG